MDALLGALPSCTQLGMAALLPGAQLSIHPADGTAVVNCQSASGTDNRDKILKAYANAAGDYNNQLLEGVSQPQAYKDCGTEAAAALRQRLRRLLMTLVHA